MASCLTHFSHHHDLVKIQSSICPGSICDLCDHTLESGFHYRCRDCDYNLHEYCAKLPETISFFAHPWHGLHLGPARTSDPRVCDLCREMVGGFFYRCITCGFDVHPHCTATKQIVRTWLHPEHSLCLAPGLCVCTACHEFNGIWVYRCGKCNINLHIKCLHGPIKPKVSNAINRTNSKARLGRFLSDVGTEVAVQTTASTIANSLTNLLFQ